MMKRAVVLSIPQVWGVRNILRSGLYERLTKRFRVLLAIPPDGRSSLLAEGLPEGDLFAMPRVSPDAAARWSLRFVKAAHRSRYRTESDRILGGWHARKSELKG